MPGEPRPGGELDAFLVSATASAWFDTAHAVGNVVFSPTAGPALLRMLGRHASRAPGRIEWVGDEEATRAAVDPGPGADRVGRRDGRTGSALMDDAWTLVRFLHLLGVATWVGGLVFLGAIAVPAARADAGPGGARPLITRIGRRFAAIGGLAWLVILVTGFGLLDHRGLSVSDLPDSEYGQRLLAKIGLLLAMGVVTVAHGAWQGPRVRRAVEAGDEASARRWKGVGAALDAFTLVASLAALWLGVSLVA